MSPLPPLLLVLLALLEAAPLAAASVTTSVWHRAEVSRDQLATAAMSTNHQVFDEILCAILATNTLWCHLFTYEDNTCVLYNVVVDSLAASPPADTATPCRSRHRNVCIVEGTPLPHGDTLEQECIPTTCWNRVLVLTYPVSSTCDAPFSALTLGCVYLHLNTKTWCEARKHCSSLNADLAVIQAADFGLLQTLLNTTAASAEVWVGVKARKWLDGRDVTTTEWSDYDPNGALDDCARMLPSNGQYRLADRGCNNNYKFLCMRTPAP